MNKHSSADALETRPALLKFEGGNVAGTIYAHRIGGQIVEAYRGYGYRYNPVARALRSDPCAVKKP
ncbi:MAG TPA: hypothetical protein VD973_10480 [Symbiobacteriaceae bacterium]|jgi:hypothetical protein|nr:hypothetical protein [Symbiobacteriaceae bacterium]